MIVLKYVIVLMVTCLPFVAIGQEAIVRSGEHPGFTRLVAPLPPGGAWTVEHVGRRVTFSIEGFTRGYDTSSVFDRIPRDRVQSIETEDGNLVLELGCDCGVAPFVLRDRFVVMDIADLNFKRPTPFVTKLAEPKQDEPGPPEVRPVLPPSDPPPFAPTFAQNDLALELRPKTLPSLARRSLNEVEQDALADMQDRLSRGLGLATTQGLLSPKPGPGLRNLISSLEPPVDDIAPAPPTGRPPLASLQSGANNIRITSSMDFLGIEKSPKEPQSLSGFSCPMDASLDVANWADGRSFDQQMGEARQLLFQEFDELDEGIALKLVRIYLHFGFGAEAQQILQLSPKLAQEEEILMDIAHIMEIGHAPENSRLSALLDCESDVALWAILARKELDIANTINPKPALLALNKLPVHLRQFLAPALSQRLLSHGDTDAAATALRSVERLPSKLPSSAKFAQAKIALDEGDVETGEAKLDDVIHDNTAYSPEALITLVETRLAAKQPLDPEIAGLIEAYAKELQGSAIGADLRRAHVLALAKSGQFDLAFNAFTELGGDADDEAANNLRRQLLRELTFAAEDVEFLEHMFAQSSITIARLPIGPKLEIATRLLDLGFAAQAQNILNNIPSHPVNSSRQILAARAALDLAQPEQALDALEGMSGEEVGLLRAKASQMAGAHTAAYVLYQQADQKQAAAQSAWLADNWDSLALHDDPLFGPMLSLAATDVEAVLTPDIEGMLARSTTALDESATARRTLRDLLDSPTLGINTSALPE